MVGSGSFGTLSLKEAAVQLRVGARGLQNHSSDWGEIGLWMTEGKEPLKVKLYHLAAECR